MKSSLRSSRRGGSRPRARRELPGHYMVYPLRQADPADPIILLVDPNGKPAAIGYNLQEFVSLLRASGILDVEILQGDVIVGCSLDPLDPPRSALEEAEYWAPLLDGDPHPDCPDLAALARYGIAHVKCSVCAKPWPGPCLHSPRPASPRLH